MKPSGIHACIHYAIPLFSFTANSRRGTPVRLILEDITHYHQMNYTFAAHLEAASDICLHISQVTSENDAARPLQPKRIVDFAKLLSRTTFNYRNHDQLK